MTLAVLVDIILLPSEPFTMLNERKALECLDVTILDFKATKLLKVWSIEHDNNIQLHVSKMYSTIYI